MLKTHRKDILHIHSKSKDFVYYKSFSCRQWFTLWSKIAYKVNKRVGCSEKCAFCTKEKFLINIYVLQS